MLGLRSIIAALALLAAATAAFPVLDTDQKGGKTPANATYVHCGRGTNLENHADPHCAKIKPAPPTVYLHEKLADGTVKTTPANITVDQLEANREARKRGEPVPHDVYGALEDRDVACIFRLHTWFATDNWGYWNQAWKQVGGCFYCDDCSRAISVNAAVTQTWTAGLSATFNEAVQASFGFSWGQTLGVSDTETCNWSNGIEYGCHSIWYQPLMSYHNGWVNYEYLTPNVARCGPNSDHEWRYINVNQAISNNGVVSGNLGCNSGCQGSDHRQCWYQNGGGVLWGNAN